MNAFEISLFGTRTNRYTSRWSKRVSTSGYLVLFYFTIFCSKLPHLHRVWFAFHLLLPSNFKSQNNARYGLIANITNEYFDLADHIICYTDGFKANSKTSYAFSIQDFIVSNLLRNLASVFTAELNAILACLSHLTHRPPRHNYLLLTDSLSSLQFVRDPGSTNSITQLIHMVLQILSTIQSSVIFIWIPGYIGHPLAQ